MVHARTLEVLEEPEAPTAEVGDKDHVKQGWDDTEKHLLEGEDGGGDAGDLLYLVPRQPAQLALPGQVAAEVGVVAPGQLARRGAAGT